MSRFAKKRLISEKNGRFFGLSRNLASRGAIFCVIFKAGCEIFGATLLKGKEMR
jgi:hypothetical protein